MSNNKSAYIFMAKDRGFSDEDSATFAEQFKAFDMDGSGSIDTLELGQVMKELGEKVTQDQLKSIIAEVDSDASGEIEFNEFLDVMAKLRSGGDSKFGAVAKKHAEVIKIKGSQEGTEHSFSEEEKFSFVTHINSIMKKDQHIGDRFPIDPESMDIFEQCKDGLILCKLINDAVPDTIDERVLNFKKLNNFTMTENCNLVVNSAKAIGCSVVNIGAQDIMEGKVHLILGLMWQIIKIGLFANVDLSHCAELFRLLEEGETLDDLMKLSPEQLLLRWVNYHLKNAGTDKRIANFKGDIKDSEAYTILLSQIKPNDCNRSPLQKTDLSERAEAMLCEADKIDCRKFVTPHDVTTGNPKLNLAFVANLFNTWPALEPLTEEEAAALEDWLFKSEGTREARAFCLWINSLGVEPFVRNLFDDLRDGLVLLKVMNKVQPGIVNWKNVNKSAPMNKFKKVENCNYCVVLGKEMKFSLVGVGGTDLVDGNQKLTLALVWQLMRAHVLNILATLSKDGKQITEDEMVAWANTTVSNAGKSSKMESFKDSSLSTSHFFLDLLSAIRPSAVDYNLVTAGDNDEDALLNAKYTISVARKLGATIFLLPEDIVEVKPKMILTLVGSIMSAALGNAQQFGDEAMAHS